MSVLELKRFKLSQGLCRAIPLINPLENLQEEMMILAVMKASLVSNSSKRHFYFKEVRLKSAKETKLELSKGISKVSMDR